jgi:hypothetical protein
LKDAGIPQAVSTTIGVSDADEQHRWHRLIDEAQVAKKGVAVWQHRTCRRISNPLLADLKLEEQLFS